MVFVLIGLLLLTLTCFAYTIALDEDKEYGARWEHWLYFTPRQLYINSKMNVVGCLISSLLLYVIVPLYALPVTIVWLIYFLCHIGRKNK